MSDPKPYRVLARKYRPAAFDTLIGQDALVRTLTNAIQAGRIAQAFILTGVRGVGKTTTARLVARALNCTGPDGTGRETAAPCGVCDNCRAIGEDRHPDVLEMDAASRTGIGDIREIIEAVRYGPVLGRYKIYIIDEVHMLSTAAFNGLLKTLEEPPDFVKFIFATTEIRRVPVTVLSRCQRFDLRRVELAVLAAHLADVAAREEAEVAPEAIQIIARAAEGSVRDGLSLLDQAIAHGAGQVRAEAVRDMLGLADRGEIFALFDHLMHGRIGPALDVAGQLYDRGADPAVVAQDLLDVTHWVTRVKVLPAVADDPARPENERERGRALAEALPMTGLSRAWQMLMKGLVEVRMAPQPMQALEMALIRMAYAADLPPPEEVVRSLTGAPQTGARAGAQAGSADSKDSAAGATAAPAGAKSAPPETSGSMPPWSERADDAGPPMMGQGAAMEEGPAEPGAAEGAVADPMPATFADLVALFQAHGEMRLAAALHHNAHPVKVVAGHLEMRLEPGLPADIVGKVSHCLKLWTARPWLVSLSSAEGEPTLAEQSQAAAAARRAEAAGHPLVQAVLEGFPGAELVEVRPLPALAGDGGTDDERVEEFGDEEPGEHDEAGPGHAGKNAGDAGRA